MEKINTGLLIRIDDISSHMNWKLMKKSEALFDEYNIKPLLGVIPNNKDREFLSYEENDNFATSKKLAKCGLGIAMHGFTHVYDTEKIKKIFLDMEENQNFMAIL